MSEEIIIAKQWLLKAKNDLLNADNNLKAEDVPFDTVCFHCQQAVEKMLKAYLVGKKEPYPITHDLFLLLEKVLLFDNSAQKLRDALSILMPYAVEVRYPDDFYMPSRQDAQEARETAEEVLKWLKDVMIEIF
jgi:HEPN domain-containing protein